MLTNNNNKKKKNNNNKSYNTISPIILLIIATLTSHDHQAKATTFMYANCSPAKYTPNTPYQTNLDTLLSTLISLSSQSSYNSFSTGTSDTAVFGLYQCRNDLNSADCSTCIQSSVNQLNLVCPQSMDASLQLEGCFMSYSHEDFRGKLDTTLVYKKCTESRTNDGDFFRRRDDVIADLEVSGGFRVSRSGTVQGYAQCLGDLNSGDCRQCVEVAVQQLKEACGSALAADVFLAKCYARYWASGYYTSSSSSDYSDDDVGRTVAIIVGILAGLAVIVVFISFLRKAC
ncbi:plasmodesmata-located protein 8-like [Dioscorea cayenensis subsp. rotundata]|uniref:Plasmodesmata-located protein 8-like n=1 Tax=Dioscorea cayennensis subsp. rotundata TaxID=55577 RepID=A0AB40CNE1_DIOCR|nr:plasmodesmata-located protein 8-like [Dioscorea cayenensis subsp. rotundata]